MSISRVEFSSCVGESSWRVELASRVGESSWRVELASLAGESSWRVELLDILYNFFYEKCDLIYSFIFFINCM